MTISDIDDAVLGEYWQRNWQVIRPNSMAIRAFRRGLQRA